MQIAKNLIDENLARVRDEVAAACRRAGRLPEEVQLMAVSKMHPVEAIREAMQAGQLLFGENRVQEMQQKHPDIFAQDSTTKPCFHLIGHLQSNKSARAVEIFDGIDSVDSLRLAERLNDAAQKLSRRLPVLIEVKLSPEDAKTGLDRRDLPQLLERFVDLHSLELRGLMTVPPWSENPETARPYFRQLRLLRDEVAAGHPRLSFPELSLGMSGDFAVAIEEGSTCVRIGTAIFGKRQYSVGDSD
jgi:hypothetical protein